MSVRSRRIGVIQILFRCFQTDSSQGCLAFMEDQAVEIVGQIGQRQFRFCACDTYCPDKQPEQVLLMGEDMLDAGAHRGFFCIGARGCFEHRFASRFAPMDAAGQHALGQPLLVALRTVCAVSPDL